jgi:hypothetical protein
MRITKQSTTANVMVFMTDSSDHITGKTGLTLTITISKNGAIFASTTATQGDRGNGWYVIGLGIGDTDTFGELCMHVTGAGADPSDLKLLVVAYDPYSVLDLGLTRFTDIYGYEQAIHTIVGHLPADPADNSEILNAISAIPNPDNAGIAAIQAKTDNLPASPASESSVTARPTLAQIEASTVLAKDATVAKESTLTGKASQSSLDIVDGIVDTIKLKTDNLPADPASDTQVNTRLATAGYTAPDNAGITAIKAKTDNLPSDPADESLLEAAIAGIGGGTADWTSDEKKQIRDALGVDGLKTTSVDGKIQNIKAKTDNLPNSPAAIENIPTAIENADAVWAKTIP